MYCALLVIVFVYENTLQKYRNAVPHYDAETVNNNNGTSDFSALKRASKHSYAIIKDSKRRQPKSQEPKIKKRQLLTDR